MKDNCHFRFTNIAKSVSYFYLIQLKIKQLCFCGMLFFILPIFLMCPYEAFSQYLNSRDRVIRKVESERTKKITHYQAIGYSYLDEFPPDDTLREGMYVVGRDLFVYPNQTMTVFPMVIIAFEPGRQIVVDGCLNVVGEENRPVLFTNVPAKSIYFLHEQEDSLWNGILVGENGRINMRYTSMQHAENGINAALTKDSLILTSVSFKNVSQPHLKVGKRRSLIVANILPSEKKIRIKEKILYSIRPKKFWIGVSCGLLAAGSLTSAVVSNAFYTKALKESGNKNKANDFEKTSNRALTSSVLCGSLSILSALGLSMTIQFPLKRNYPHENN